MTFEADNHNEGGSSDSEGERVVVWKTCGITFHSVNVRANSRPPGRSKSSTIDARKTLYPHYGTAIEGADI